MDDIFDDISNAVYSPDGSKDPDLITSISRNDLSQFFSLECVGMAMKRVCEIKGTLEFYDVLVPVSHNLQKSLQKSLFTDILHLMS